VRIGQGAFEGRKDQMMRGKQDTEKCSVRRLGLEARCLVSRCKVWWVFLPDIARPYQVFRCCKLAPKQQRRAGHPRARPAETQVRALRQRLDIFQPR
jgi:hypothetical protein